MNRIATWAFAAAIFTFTALGLAAAQPNPIHATTAPTHFAPHPQTPACRIIENRARTPGIATFYCTGTGIAQLNIRCTYYDNGPYLRRYTNRAAPVTTSLSCTSSYPFLIAAWTANIPNP